MGEVTLVRCEVCGFEWDPRVRLLGAKGCPNAVDHPEVHRLKKELAGEEAERLKLAGQLDIALRVLSGEADDTLAIEYGGTGWEKCAAVEAAYNARKRLAKEHEEGMLLQQEMMNKQTLWEQVTRERDEWKKRFMDLATSLEPLFHLCLVCETKDHKTNQHYQQNEREVSHGDVPRE